VRECKGKKERNKGQMVYERLFKNNKVKIKKK
jgi:hypothetical protein